MFRALQESMRAPEGLRKRRLYCAGVAEVPVFKPGFAASDSAGDVRAGIGRGGTSAKSRVLDSVDHGNAFTDLGLPSGGGGTKGAGYSGSRGGSDARTPSPYRRSLGGDAQRQASPGSCRA